MRKKWNADKQILVLFNTEFPQIRSVGLHGKLTHTKTDSTVLGNILTNNSTSLRWI